MLGLQCFCLNFRVFFGSCEMHFKSTTKLNHLTKAKRALSIWRLQAKCKLCVQVEAIFDPRARGVREDGERWGKEPAKVKILSRLFSGLARVFFLSTNAKICRAYKSKTVPHLTFICKLSLFLPLTLLLRLFPSRFI